MKTAKSHRGSKSAAGVSKGKEATTGKPDAVLKKKGSAVLVQQVVSIWEDLRPRQASAEVKQKLVSDILKVGKGKLKELAVKSKSSRVIQALLKNGTKEQRQKIWSECKDHIVEISMSPYGNHVVRKFISIASKEQLSAILRACKGTIVKLFKHPCGSAVVADLYEELPAADRNAIVAEFYSRETALLGAKTSTATLKSLVDAWPTMDSTEKRSTMQRLILALNPIIEKAYVDPPAIHRLVSEYMRLAPSDMVQDTVESLIGEATLRMVHTHEGCRVGCMVAAYSTPKQRKKLVKSMKGHVLKMCLDEFAYIVLIKTLAVVDDTEMVRKALVSELQSNLEDILSSQNGIKVVLSLVSTETKHLPPHALELLSPADRTVTVAVEDDEQNEEKEGDDQSEEEKDEEKHTETKVLGLSKKESLVRRRELLSTGKGSLSASLLEHCAHHAAEMLSTQHGGEVLECMCCGGDVGSWLWDQNQDSVAAVHAAVAAALGHQGGAPNPEVPGAKDTKPEDAGGKKEKKSNSADDGTEAVCAAGEGSGEDADVAVRGDDVAAEVGKDLTEDFFATRALKRMVTCAHGASGEGFLRKLWEGAIKGNGAKLKGTHTCKVVAALAQCPVQEVASGVRRELSVALKGENVDDFLGKFTKPPKAKGSGKGKAPKKSVRTLV